MRRCCVVALCLYSVGCGRLPPLGGWRECREGCGGRRLAAFRWVLGAALGFACGRCGGLGCFRPLALSQLARAASLLVAFGLLRSEYTDPSCLTRRSSRSAFGGRLALCAKRMDHTDGNPDIASLRLFRRINSSIFITPTVDFYFSADCRLIAMDFFHRVSSTLPGRWRIHVAHCSFFRSRIRCGRDFCRGAARLGYSKMNAAHLIWR